jgi:IS30 family transposase
MVRKLVASSVLFGRVVAHLHRGLSPERIAFTRNRIDQPVRISHETIYTALYAIHPTDEDLSAGTPATPPHGRRPVRGDPGHWQGGQIKGKRNQFQVGTLVERTTLYVTLVKLENGRAETAAESFAEILNRFDAALHDV